MSKLTIKEALELIPVSESTLRRAIRTGEVSTSKDKKGRNLIDVAELERVYGALKYVNDTDMAGTDTSKIVDLLKEQVSDLKGQIAELTTDKSELMSMLKIEQEKTRQFQLMLPAPAAETKKMPVWRRIFRLT